MLQLLLLVLQSLLLATLLLRKGRQLVNKITHLMLLLLEASQGVRQNQLTRQQSSNQLSRRQQPTMQLIQLLLQPMQLLQKRREVQRQTAQQQKERMAQQLQAMPQSHLAVLVLLHLPLNLRSQVRPCSTLSKELFVLLEAR
jgi:hypothetical protein